MCRQKSQNPPFQFVQLLPFLLPNDFGSCIGLAEMPCCDVIPQHQPNTSLWFAIFRFIQKEILHVSVDSRDALIEFTNPAAFRKSP